MRSHHFEVFAFATLAIIVLACAGPAARAQDTKRGFAGGSVSLANSQNSRWLYDWSNTPPADIDNFIGEYIPMIWSSNTSNVGPKITNILSYQNDLNVEYVLGFNEPERVGQANMSVQQAIDVWDIMTDGFEGTGIKLVSPGVSGSEGKVWLDEFMAEVDLRNGDADPDNDLRVDDIAFHWYGNVNPNNPAGSAQNFLNTVDQYYNDYGNRPIWVTEFGGLDFGDDDVTSPDLIAANAAFLDIVIPGLESRPYVKRYSWWQYGQPDNGEQDDTRLITESNGVFTPTVIGDEYIPSIQAGETRDLNGVTGTGDTLYLRGGTATNTGAAAPAAVRGLHAIEGVNEITGTSDWSASTGSIDIAAGAQLRKTGSAAIGFQVNQITNEGAFTIEQGTVGLESGARISGGGELEVGAGGSLALGVAPDRAGAIVDQPLKLTGGTVVANTIIDGIHSISQPVTLEQTSIFDGGGVLLVNAPIEAPSGGGGGGLTKRGSGVLLLNAANTYEGDTRVEAGTLRLGASASMASSPLLVVGSEATFDVAAQANGYTTGGQDIELHGDVNGSLAVTSGAVLSVLDSDASVSGNVTLSNGTLRVGGVGFTEAGQLPAPVTTGLTLNYDAALDTPGDATFTNAAGVGNDLTFAGPVSANPVVDASTPGVTNAIDLASAGSAGGLNGYFEGLNPQRSRRDATFEVVFEVPENGGAGDQVLFELGGAARGVSFTLTGDTLSFNVDGDGPTLTLDTTVDAGWRHVVGVIDIEGTLDDLSNDAIHLYVDNQLVGTLSDQLIDDWAGGNPATIGGPDLSTPSPNGAPSAFLGNLAAARYYADVTFDAADVSQNFASLTGIGAEQPTATHIGGDLVVEADGVLELDISDGGLSDTIMIDGDLEVLGGTLALTHLGSTPLATGDEFTLFGFTSALGAFDAVTLPVLAEGLRWDASRLFSDGVLAVGIEGDNNGDGVVSAADFAVWRGLAGTNPSPWSGADGDGDGLVSTADLDGWRGAFGSQAGAASLSGGVSVPEPTGVFLSTIVAALGALFRPRRIMATIRARR